MPQLNPRYEAIFNPDNIDMARLRVSENNVKSCLDIVEREQARPKVSFQLLKSMVNHFVEDEHWCYFDDWYCPDFELRTIYEQIKKYDIGDAAQQLLDVGHDEIRQTVCYDNYGLPSYIR